MREARRLVFTSEYHQSSIGMVTYDSNQLVQHGIEWWRADPRNNDGKGRGTNVAQIPTKSEVSGLSAVLALSYRRRHNSAGEALLFPFLLKLSPSPTSSLPFNHSSPLPKWPPLLALSAPSPPRPLPRSLSLPPAALRLLSASRGEPGASPRAHLVSYSVPPSWQSESPERFCRRIGYVEISYMPC